MQLTVLSNNAVCEDTNGGQESYYALSGLHRFLLPVAFFDGRCPSLMITPFQGFTFSLQIYLLEARNGFDVSITKFAIER